MISKYSYDFLVDTNDSPNSMIISWWYETLQSNPAVSLPARLENSQLWHLCSLSILLMIVRLSR